MVAGIASRGGASGRILRNIGAGQLGLVVSSDIKAEYFEIAARSGVLRLFQRFKVAQERYLSLLEAITLDAELIDPVGAAPLCRDEKDRKYLHCALTARADFLVTHDLDLLDLASVGSTPILRPGPCLQALSSLGIKLDP